VTELYENSIRLRVETPENIGKIVSINVETGEYEIGDDLLPQPCLPCWKICQECLRLGTKLQSWDYTGDGKWGECCDRNPWNCRKSSNPFRPWRSFAFWSMGIGTLVVGGWVAQFFLGGLIATRNPRQLPQNAPTAVRFGHGVVNAGKPVASGVWNGFGQVTNGAGDSLDRAVRLQTVDSNNWQHPPVNIRTVRGVQTKEGVVQTWKMQMLDAWREREAVFPD
jgi:hypothetical protein